MTAQDIIQDACEKLGVYAPGETISSDDANRGLIVLNDLVDEWLGERIPLYVVDTLAFPIVAGQWAYTIGFSNVANIAAIRPDRILEGVGKASVTITASGFTSAVDVVSAVEWDAFYASPDDPNYQATPDRLAYDPAYPLGLLRLAPVPNAAGTVSFGRFFPFTGFAALATAYAMAPVQDSALRYNLAVALKPYFQTGNLPAEVIALAPHTKMQLRYGNRLSRATIRPDARSPRAAPAAPAPAAAPVR